MMLFVNRRLRLVPAMLADDFAGPWDAGEVLPLRDALWADDSLRQAFIAENPAGLSAADLAIVESWQHRRRGELLHPPAAQEARDCHRGGGLDGLRRARPRQPAGGSRAVSALLREDGAAPVRGPIIYDSLLAGYNSTFGGGIRRSLEKSYRDAKERGAVITTLLPTAPASREEGEAAARSTDAKVLDAFRTSLYRSGLSPKVVERDVANAAAFAEGYLLNQAGPRSLGTSATPTCGATSRISRRRPSRKGNGGRL